MKAALRLRRPADFARVKRSGVVYRHPTLLINVCRNERPHNRYGIVTTKRLGNAVVRNKCRRRLRACLARLNGKARHGFDIVIVARPAAAGQPFRELHRIVKGLLLQARLMESCCDAKVGAAARDKGI